MSKRPWFPFYPADYRQDTLDLTNEQHGVYFTMLCLTWLGDGKLTSDMDVLKRMLQGWFAGFHGHTFNACVPMLLKRYFFKSSDGFYHQKRVDRELEKAVKLSSNARQSSLKRWSGSKENNDLADANAMLSTSTRSVEREESKNTKVLDFAGAKPEESREGFGYSNFDGSVSFTAAEITALSLKFYTLTNVYSQIARLSETDWCAGMRPQDRKKSIIGNIRNVHNKRLRNMAPDPIDQVKSAQDAERARGKEAQERLAAREEIMGRRRISDGSS